MGNDRFTPADWYYPWQNISQKLHWNKCGKQIMDCIVKYEWRENTRLYLTRLNYDLEIQAVAYS